jgi:hypothetical protein
MNSPRKLGKRRRFKTGREKKKNETYKLSKKAD